MLQVSECHAASSVTVQAITLKKRQNTLHPLLVVWEPNRGPSCWAGNSTAKPNFPLDQTPSHMRSNDEMGFCMWGHRRVSKPQGSLPFQYHLWPKEFHTWGVSQPAAWSCSDRRVSLGIFIHEVLCDGFSKTPTQQFCSRASTLTHGWCLLN